MGWNSISTNKIKKILKIKEKIFFLFSASRALDIKDSEKVSYLRHF